MKILNVLVPLSIASMGICAPTGAGPVPFLQEAQEEKPKVDYSKAGNETIFVPVGVDLLEEKALPLDESNPDNVNAIDQRLARGMRQFVTQLDPKQTLKLSLKATPMDSYTVNWILPSDKKHPLYTKIKLSYDSQMSRRSPIISMKNTAKEPCFIFFSVTGPVAQPYSVKVEKK